MSPSTSKCPKDYEVVDGPFTGTFGEVYILKHKTMGYMRALKCLLSHVKPEIITEEALKQKDIKSPYVVRIIEYYAEEKAILMEYYPKGLDSYLKGRLAQTNSRIPYEECRDLIYGILQGLNDAHAAGVVHGDLKPANVRIGDDSLPKLSDFGAAMRIREETRPLRGSCNWMAPELLGSGTPTVESDYFSFGVLAYLILSGRHPFHTDDPSGLTTEEDNIRSETFKPVPLRELRQDVPERTADLVMALLARDRDQRKRAAESLQVELSPKPPEAAPLTQPVMFALAATKPSPDEATEVFSAYEMAKLRFFGEYRPKEAADLLEKRLIDLQWQRFVKSKWTALADCWSFLAYIKNASRRFDEAIVCATHGLEVDEDHVSSLHGRGYAYLRIGDYDHAKEDLLVAYKLAAEPKKREQIANLLVTIGFSEKNAKMQESARPRKRPEH